MMRILLVTTPGVEGDRLGAVLRERKVELRVARSCLEAAEIVGSFLPELIVASSKLPDLGLSRFCGALRAQRQNAAVPIVGFGEGIELLLSGGVDELIDVQHAVDEIWPRLERVLRDRERVMRGDLSCFPIFDVVQLLSSGNHSGILRLTFGEAEGELHFLKGQVVHAQFNAAEGEAAFLETLRCARMGGYFSFRGSSIISQKTISARTDHLLLKLANQLDESSETL